MRRTEFFSALAKAGVEKKSVRYFSRGYLALLLCAGFIGASTQTTVADTLTTTRGAALYRLPRRSSRVLARLAPGTSLRQTGSRRGWVRVRHRRRVGWLRRGDVRASKPSVSPKVPSRTATTLRTPLFSKPGEATKKVAILPQGTPVKVRRHRGRWVFVKANGKKGWLPRTTIRRVPAKSSAVAEANTDGARWRKQGWIKVGNRDKPVQRARQLEVTTGRAVAHAGPRTSTVRVFEVRKGERLVIAGRSRDGAWILTENRDGLTGWIPAGSVRRPAPSSDVATPDASRPTLSSAAPEAGPNLTSDFMRPGKRIRARARLGVSSIGMQFSSDGSSDLSDYRVSANAAAVAASITAERVGASGIVLGGGVNYALSVGQPGIRYHDGAGGELAPVGFSLQQVDAGARIGYQHKAAFAVNARLGYHFDWFQVAEVDNPGLLARESLRGFTVGAHLEVPLSREIIVRGGLDVLLGARRKQTPGLEDGGSADISGLWGKLEVSYLLSHLYAIEGAYQAAWSSTSWEGQSMRQVDVTAALRIDKTHLFLLGINRSF